MSGVNNLSLIKKYIDSNTSVITLNNSDGGNILNLNSMTELLNALKSSIDDKDVRVIIIKSNGNNFCLGMDLVMLQSVGEKKGIAEEAIDLYIDMLSFIYTCKQPVICIINGAVKAGGIGLINACDIVISSDKSTFELSEVYFGLIPANLLPYLFLLRIPPQKVRYLILTAKRLKAEEAERLNLVDEVFSIEDIEKGIKLIIKNLFRASPYALAETKLFTKTLIEDRMSKISKMAKDKLLEMTSKKEVIEAVKSFNEGNVPEWFDKYKPEHPLINQ